MQLETKQINELLYNMCVIWPGKYKKENLKLVGSACMV